MALVRWVEADYLEMPSFFVASGERLNLTPT
jgi:hypothetical protein